MPFPHFGVRAAFDFGSGLSGTAKWDRGRGEIFRGHWDRSLGQLLQLLQPAASPPTTHLS